ncbi:GNAT family N-acetyltransferase [Kitasatospora viridis]|uniref:RimJ/RimL family protein N-acetyltransferase n=1 Tax=Kitasatospora viridis TaxID=281105 RepID=A0A561ULD1_9ACTN|nr:GNAT family protein [Kitasatospora viridis]TWG00155.1 RimJ/RimL family protein N-acetyltransferase [Kitasatospora viridis]
MTALSDFSVKPTLVGDLVVLRPFAVDEDAEAIRDFLTDPETARFANGEEQSGRSQWTAERERVMREWYGTRHEQPDRLDLAVVDRATGRCVGEAVLNEWQPARQSCNFRIILTAAGRDRGLGTEAVRLTVGYGFERLGLHRVSLGVYAHNSRARRAYEKAGFVLEGTEREVIRVGDGWVDNHVMAVLDREWERHRGRP